MSVQDIPDDDADERRVIRGIPKSGSGYPLLIVWTFCNRKRQSEKWVRCVYLCISNKAPVVFDAMSTTDLGLVSIKLLTDSFADQVNHEWRGPTIDVNHDINSCITDITNHHRSNRVGS